MDKKRINLEAERLAFYNAAAFIGDHYTCDGGDFGNEEFNSAYRAKCKLVENMLNAKAQKLAVKLQHYDGLNG